MLFAKRIEEASLNAWPSLAQILFDGWILRFSKGYTKRANSVNPLYDGASPIQDKVVVCERLYAEKQLPCIFRLTSFASHLELDALLAGRRYAKIDPTNVMHLTLSDYGSAGGLVELSFDEWASTFARLSGMPAEKQKTHMEIVQKIASDRLFACLENAGEAVAVGLGVLENDYFGLFDLVTASEDRNRGFGTRLVQQMVSWAQQRRAWHAYLQVTEANAVARHVYSTVGFRDLYNYWYRVPHTFSPPGK